MSDVVDAAVKALNARLGDGPGLGGSVKFEIEDEGAVRIDGAGATADESPADCTISATAETFEGLLRGEVNPTTAFMTGKLRVEGDMGLAMKLGSILG